MVKIKICGLRRLEDIEIVNKYKPDYVGFVFADSKRKVSHKLAGQMKNNLSSDIISVGVFVDAPQNEIIKLFKDDIIEIAQLHGRESEDYINNLKENTNDELKIIKAIEMSDEEDLSEYDNSCRLFAS
ncbi:MAG: phosphoribosylanthranilate isomerase [Methanobrevibacter sp.]|nr:phosphoribosylanthranilate isomerase [Methanobrevibacter sp.]